VKGAIPGANGDDVVVRSAIKGQRALPPVVVPVVAAKAAAKPAAKPAAKK
jgi:hypothetical protein